MWSAWDGNCGEPVTGWFEIGSFDACDETGTLVVSHSHRESMLFDNAQMFSMVSGQSVRDL